MVSGSCSSHVLHVFKLAVNYVLLYFTFNVSKSCPGSFSSAGSLLVRPALTPRVSPGPFRSCPYHHSRPRAVLYPHLMPRSPARRSLACVQTCPAVRNHHLPCRQPAREPWLRLRRHLRSPPTDVRAGPQTRKAALKETRLCSGSASCPVTPPSGMWRKFMTSSDLCQVRRGHSFLQSGTHPSTRFDAQFLYLQHNKMKNECCFYYLAVAMGQSSVVLQKAESDKICSVLRVLCLLFMYMCIV